LFVLAGIYIKYINFLLTVRFSFLTCSLFVLSFKKRTARCTACLYGMLSRIIVLRRKLNYLPKASTKVELFSELTNVLEEKFQKR